MYKNTEIIEIVKNYEEVIQHICNLFIKLGVYKDPVKIFENFYYMYNNGFLSSNGMYSDILPRECINLELAGYISMDIAGIMLFYGYGVCRHTTDFLAHIYQNLGYNNSQLFTYHPLLSIRVDNYSKKFLINSEIQKYIDEATNSLDLFSKEEILCLYIYSNTTILTPNVKDFL